MYTEPRPVRKEGALSISLQIERETRNGTGSGNGPGSAVNPLLYSQEKSQKLFFPRDCTLLHLLPGEEVGGRTKNLGWSDPLIWFTDACKTLIARFQKQKKEGMNSVFPLSRGAHWGGETPPNNF